VQSTGGGGQQGQKTQIVSLQVQVNGALSNTAQAGDSITLRLVVKNISGQTLWVEVDTFETGNLQHELDLSTPVQMQPGGQHEFDMNFTMGISSLPFTIEANVYDEANNLMRPDSSQSGQIELASGGGGVQYPAANISNLQLSYYAYYKDYKLGLTFGDALSVRVDFDYVGPPQEGDVAFEIGDAFGFSGFIPIVTVDLPFTQFGPAMTKQHFYVEFQMSTNQDTVPANKMPSGGHEMRCVMQGFSGIPTKTVNGPDNDIKFVEPDVSPPPPGNPGGTGYGSPIFTSLSATFSKGA
jgi:hypothetical protein